MVKFTPAYLKKLEDLLKEGDYEVRYEKGNFKSGYCILEAKRVVVINKFSTLESRIQALVEIIQAMSASGHLNADLKQAGLKNPIRNASADGESDAEIDFDESAPDQEDLETESSSETADKGENSSEESSENSTNGSESNNNK